MPASGGGGRGAARDAAARERIAPLAEIAAALAENLPTPKATPGRSRRRRRRKRGRQAQTQAQQAQAQQQEQTQEPQAEASEQSEEEQPKRRRRRPSRDNGAAPEAGPAEVAEPEAAEA